MILITSSIGYIMFEWRSKHNHVIWRSWHFYKGWRPRIIDNEVHDGVINPEQSQIHKLVYHCTTTLQGTCWVLALLHSNELEAGYV